MTLILAAANSEQVVMLADCRLTSSGVPRAEDAGKLCAFVLGGARYAVGFTGLARVGSFDTRRWLLDALWECAEPKLITSMPTLMRFRERVSRDFAQVPDLRRLSPADKRTEFMFVGYGNRKEEHPVLMTALVSNFRDTMHRTTTSTSWSEFALSAGREELPRTTEPGGVVWAGAWQAITARDVNGLNALLTQRKPYRAIVDKAIEVMMEAALRPAAAGTVNKRVMWLRVPSTYTESIESGHSSAQPLYETFMVDTVVRRPDGSSAFAYVTMSSLDRHLPPHGALPKVHRHSPCPCKSGKRYKSCHGSPGLFRHRGSKRKRPPTRTGAGQ